jgi:hypothetical protein
MARINIIEYDEAEERVRLIGWFDPRAAEKFAGRTEWNGHNQVSVHAGEHNHEDIYHTAGGRWVRNWYSDWQGSPDAYEFITPERAQEWLILNNDDEAVERLFGEPEPERGPGRPAVGPMVNVRMDDEMIARLDEEAATRGESRAATIRRMLIYGLASTSRIGADPTNTPHRWLEFAGWQQHGVEIEDAPEGYYEPYYWDDEGQYLGSDPDGVEPIYTTPNGAPRAGIC